MKNESFYITTPVFYPSDKPHLGHALTVIFADCMKRYYSELGYKCFLSVGTDEHGEKIFLSAKNANKPVEQFIEENVEKFKNLWFDLGIDYDKFVRTSDVVHKTLVKKIFSQFLDTNQIFFDEWKGWYCNSCEENYSFRSIGKLAICKLGHPLLFCNEKSYFLRVSSFKTWLLKKYKEEEKLIYPEHYKKEMINNFVNNLDDLSISRENGNWGIKVPNSNEHTIYVWFDALINYLTALNYGKNSSLYQTYWQDSSAKVVHIIGKEICRFHSIYWPIILENLNIRSFDSLLVHGWLLMNDEKMSKSKKNVIDPQKILKYLPRESLRLYLSKINYWNDNNVNYLDIFNTYNSYLSNTFGNLISRFYGIVEKHFNYVVPKLNELEETIEIDQINMEINSFLETEYEELVLSNNYFLLVEKVFDWFRTVGRLIEKHKIWNMNSEDIFLKNLISFIYKLLCVGSWILKPILIDSAPKLHKLFNLSEDQLNLENLKKEDFFSVDRKINPLKEIFFPRLKTIPVI